jgi:septal ring factor EnvC (AmiA/AmiB activator)
MGLWNELRKGFAEGSERPHTPNGNGYEEPRPHHRATADGKTDTSLASLRATIASRDTVINQQKALIHRRDTELAELKQIISGLSAERTECNSVIEGLVANDEAQRQRIGELQELGKRAVADRDRLEKKAVELEAQLAQGANVAFLSRVKKAIIVRLHPDRAGSDKRLQAALGRLCNDLQSDLDAMAQG